MTAHVSTSMNRSPTRIAVLSAFHQQRIGADSTSPAPGARGAVWATAACTPAPPITMAATTIRNDLVMLKTPNNSRLPKADLKVRLYGTELLPKADLRVR